MIFTAGESQRPTLKSFVGRGLAPAVKILRRDVSQISLLYTVGVSYFLSGEKVCKEPPGTSRMVPGLSRRPKGEADRMYSIRIFLRFPLRKPFERFNIYVFCDCWLFRHSEDATGFLWHFILQKEYNYGCGKIGRSAACKCIFLF